MVRNFSSENASVLFPLLSRYFSESILLHVYCIIKLSVFYFVLQIVGQTGNAPQLIYTMDPQLAQLGLTQYPPLPASTDTTKLEEIRRTVAISNLDTSVSTLASYVCVPLVRFSIELSPYRTEATPNRRGRRSET